jgi:hypothetical protein
VVQLHTAILRLDGVGLHRSEVLTIHCVEVLLELLALLVVSLSVVVLLGRCIVRLSFG